MPSKERSRTYRAWESMKQRCNATSHPRYSDWGGRGINYSPTWESFFGFLADMGECPDGLTLDRKNNEENYSKENCRWATYSQQNLNRRTPKNNVSGVKGVSWNARARKWQVIVKEQNKSRNLYTGSDFFYAVCKRKSWETKNTQI